MIVKTARQYLFLLPRDRRELGANLIKMFPADLTGPSRAGRLLSVGPDFKCQHSDGGGERPEVPLWLISSLLVNQTSGGSVQPIQNIDNFTQIFSTFRTI